MESELVPGYDFEHTYDGVLLIEYDKYYHKNYEINRGYLENHIEELIKLPDAYVHLPGTVGKAKKFISERYELDLDVANGKLGLYQWYNLFGKFHRGQNYEDTKEDYCRMFLDLVDKYPEHSDIINLKEEIKEGTYIIPYNSDDSLEERVNQFREEVKPIKNMVDNVYTSLINEELIYLDDFIPPEFLSDYAFKKRFQWMDNEKPVLFEILNLYLEQCYNFDTVIESVIFVMGEMKEFIDKHPQYSQLIPDYDAFVKYGDKLIKELGEE